MWIYDKRDKVEDKLKTYLDMSRFPVIHGYDMEKMHDIDEFINSFMHMGFQGSNLGIAIDMFRRMMEEREKGLKIFISFTGNMISSGNRELITFLAKHKHIDGITTNAAGIEEDIIKCHSPFHLGTFNANGSYLLDECMGRIGNIFVPADRYLYLERFLKEVFPKINSRSAKGDVPSSHEVAEIIGDEIEKSKLTSGGKESSFLYWAKKNKIPVFCPGITDGAIGDMAVFFRRNNKSFAIDSTKDNEVLSRMLSDAERCGSIILGGGIAKHFLLNSAIFRDGFEHSIYITTAAEHDGSDSGGNQEEAISWAKIKPSAERVKVVCDATIAFPILMLGTFSNEKHDKRKGQSSSKKSKTASR